MRSSSNSGTTKRSLQLLHAACSKPRKERCSLTLAQTEVAEKRDGEKSTKDRSERETCTGPSLRESSFIASLRGSRQYTCVYSPESRLDAFLRACTTMPPQPCLLHVACEQLVESLTGCDHTRCRRANLGFALTFTCVRLSGCASPGCSRTLLRFPRGDVRSLAHVLVKRERERARELVLSSS